MATVGIGSGKVFRVNNFDIEIQKALETLVADIYTELDGAFPGDALFGVNTTHPDAQIGDYKTDYNLRSIVTYKGFGALPSQECFYYTDLKDADGMVLDGSKSNYTIHIKADEFPPAKSFWSYTIYNQSRYLVENPINRYMLGNLSEMSYNEDGSLDIYLSYKAPDDTLIANWLPIPNGIFDVTVRLYWPEPALLTNPSIWNDPKPMKKALGEF